MNPWLHEAMSAIDSDVELSAEDTKILLDLAAHAAHEGGARTNAPLLCYLVGRVQGDRDLDELAAAIRESSA